MYSIALQIMVNLIKLGIIFSFHPNRHSTWWKFYAGICWPLSFPLTTSTLFPKTIRMIESFRIISNTMNNVLLLLSFGLCSPVLGCCIMLSITVNLCSWLMLTGRFLILRLNSPASHDPEKPFGGDSETDIVTGSFSSPLNQNFYLDHQSRPSQAFCSDEFVKILSEQVEGVHRHLVECKWPVICTSCFFMTMFSWEIVGDEMGWLGAVWVPVLGVVILVIVVVWDNFLVRGKIGLLGLPSSTRTTLNQPLLNSLSGFDQQKS
jgi:hypothetical protein